jgi:putative spermidine/putrescine transport system substrate-binding protein
VDANAEAPKAGDPLTFSWGGGSTQEGVEKYVKPAVQSTLGLNMNVLGAASSDTMAQIIGQGGAGDLDVVLTSFGPLQQGRGADVLSKLDYSVMPETQSLDAKHLDPGGDDLAITTSEFAYGLAYNKDLFAQKGLPEPTKVADMLDPKYSSVLGLYAPPFAGAVAQIAIINAALGGPPEDVSTGLNALAKVDAAEVIENSAQMDSEFAAGNVGMYFSASATVQTFVDSGMNVGMAFSPAYGTGIYAVIPKNPPHPGAACAFVNWLASVEGQEALQKVNGNLPTRRDGVTLRPDTVMTNAADQEILDYPALVSKAPSAEALTEQWNEARG